jgi:hypothetical protein
MCVLNCMPKDNARRYDMARLYTFPDDVRIYRFKNEKNEILFRLFLLIFYEMYVIKFVVHVKYQNVLMI